MNNGCIPAVLEEEKEELTTVCELCSLEFPGEDWVQTDCKCDTGYTHYECKDKLCIHNKDVQPDDIVVCTICTVCNGKSWIRTCPECDIEFSKLYAEDIQNLNEVARLLSEALGKEIKPLHS